MLSEGDEETGAYDPLDRLKMAMNYEEKKARNQGNCSREKKLGTPGTQWLDFLHVLRFVLKLYHTPGEPKNTPTHKRTVSQKCANIFVLNFANLFRRQLCKSVQFCAVFTLHTPTLRTNFATVQTVQKADFIIKVIECLIPSLL